MVISPTKPRLARLAIGFWIARTLRSVELASASISLTTCCGVPGRPSCRPRAWNAFMPAVTHSLGTDAALIVDTGLGPANGERVLYLVRRLAGSRRLLLGEQHNGGRNECEV